MKFKLLVAASALASLIPAWAESSETIEPALQDVITVIGQRTAGDNEDEVSPNLAPLFGEDLTRVVARTPGAARLGNGELSGQVSYRGMSGERINLRIDGQRFASGGPNLMDPVFHYAPSPLVDVIVIDRGVGPVSDGPGLGGGADAVYKRVDFATGDTPEFEYDLTLSGRTVNDGLILGGMVGAATEKWRLSLLGSHEEAGDTAFPGGTIAGTGFERGAFGLSGDLKTELGVIGIDLRRHNTGPSGNPPFPMDIVYFDTDFARVRYAHTIRGVDIEGSFNSADVTHLMDNFSQRPSPSPMQTSATFADGTTVGFDLSGSGEAWGGLLQIGVDGEQADHNVRITNPNNAQFFVTPFPEVKMERIGMFGEWTRTSGSFNAELGLRIDQHDYASGEAVTGPALPMGPRMLAGNFNTADRSGSDTTTDLVARFWTDQKNGLSWRATLARKEKVPGYIQRFGWLPINASGGLADGNIYVGNLDLQPETALIAEAGFDYANDRFFARPTVYLRQVDDFIQGTPFDETPGVINSPVEMIANMNGDPTPLKWRNVDARIMGLDMDTGYDFEGPLRVDGTVSIIDGERRDIDDNLYRMPPASLLLGLTWEGEAYSLTLESQAVAEQDQISVTNEEMATPGYVVLSAFADWQVRDGVMLSVGVENLLDHLYRDHLSGYNRNGFGDVLVGQRVPGAGRGAFLRLSLRG